MGLDSAQCTNMATLYGMACTIDAYGYGYNVLSSYSLTVEICTQICSSHGFNYTGLTT